MNFFEKRNSIDFVPIRFSLLKVIDTKSLPFRFEHPLLKETKCKKIIISVVEINTYVSFQSKPKHIIDTEIQKMLEN